MPGWRFPRVADTLTAEASQVLWNVQYRVQRIFMSAAWRGEERLYPGRGIDDDS